MKKTLISLVSRNKFDRILILIYILNIFDYLFTLVLVSSGLFIEVNPLLSMDIQGTGGFILKCIVPMMLLLYLHVRIALKPPVHQKAVKMLLSFIFSYYAVINAFHIFWLAYFIVMFRWKNSVQSDHWLNAEIFLHLSKMLTKIYW